MWTIVLAQLCSMKPLIILRSNFQGIGPKKRIYFKKIDNQFPLRKHAGSRKERLTSKAITLQKTELVFLRLRKRLGFFEINFPWYRLKMEQKFWKSKEGISGFFLNEPMEGFFWKNLKCSMKGIPFSQLGSQEMLPLYRLIFDDIVKTSVELVFRVSFLKAYGRNHSEMPEKWLWFLLRPLLPWYLF